MFQNTAAYQREIEGLINSIVHAVKHGKTPDDRLNLIASKHGWDPQFGNYAAIPTEGQKRELDIPVEHQLNGYKNIYVQDRTVEAGEQAYYKVSLVFEEAISKEDWTNLYQSFEDRWVGKLGKPDHKDAIECYGKELNYAYWQFDHYLLGLQQAYEINFDDEQTLDIIVALPRAVSKIPMGIGLSSHSSFLNFIDQFTRPIQKLIESYSKEKPFRQTAQELIGTLRAMPAIAENEAERMLYLNITFSEEWVYLPVPIFWTDLSKVENTFTDLHWKLVNVTRFERKGIDHIFKLIEDKLENALDMEVIKKGTQKMPFGESDLPYVYWKCNSLLIGLQDARFDFGHTDPSIDFLILPYTEEVLSTIPKYQIDDLNN